MPKKSNRKHVPIQKPQASDQRETQDIRLSFLDEWNMLLAMAEDE